MTIVDRFLQYLASVRPSDDQQPPLDSPHEEAWEDFAEQIHDDPEKSWPLILEVLQRCDERDLPMIGVSILEPLLGTHPKKFAERYEKAIRNDARFLGAFQFAAMTGVPLDIQQGINAAMLERGVDPKLVVEYDEVEE